MSRAGKRWSKDEDRALQRQVQKGVGRGDLRREGRSRASIANRISRLGLGTVRWSKAEEESLKRALADGLDDDQIVVGRKTVEQIRQRRRKLGVYKAAYRNRWTRVEVAELRRQVRSGVELGSIRVGERTEGQVYRKLRQLGIQPVGPGLQWRETEEKSLRTQLKRTGDIGAVEIPGRSARAVKGRARELGLKWARKGAWTEAEVARLREEIGAGKRVNQIVLEGRTAVAVRNQAKRLGLLETKPRVTRAWTAAELNKLKSLVEQGMSAHVICNANHFAGRTKDSIAQQMRRGRMARSRVAYRMRLLAIQRKEERGKKRRRGK